MSIGTGQPAPWSPILLINPEDFESVEEYLAAVQAAYDQWQYDPAGGTRWSPAANLGYVGDIDPLNPEAGGYYFAPGLELMPLSISDAMERGLDLSDPDLVPYPDHIAEAIVQQQLKARRTTEALNPLIAIPAYFQQTSTGAQAISAEDALMIERLYGRETLEAIAAGGQLIVKKWGERMETPDGVVYKVTYSTFDPQTLSWTHEEVLEPNTQTGARRGQYLYVAMPDGELYRAGGQVNRVDKGEEAIPHLRDYSPPVEEVIDIPTSAEALEEIGRNPWGTPKGGWNIDPEEALDTFGIDLPPDGQLPPTTDDTVGLDTIGPAPLDESLLVDPVVPLPPEPVPVYASPPPPQVVPTPPPSPDGIGFNEFGPGTEGVWEPQNPSATGGDGSSLQGFDDEDDIRFDQNTQTWRINGAGRWW